MPAFTPILLSKLLKSVDDCILSFSLPVLRLILDHRFLFINNKSGETTGLCTGRRLIP